MTALAGPPERVLVVRLDNVGDVVMLGPALRALRLAWPGTHLTLYASPAGTQVASMLPWVDEVITDSVAWQDASGAVPLDPAREQARIERWRAARYDVALVFTSWSQSPWPAAYAAYLAGIPVRAGESKEFGGSVLTHAVPCLPDGVHQVDRNLHLVAGLGVAPAGIDLELHPDQAAHDAAAAALEPVGDAAGPLVVVAPGASCPARRYPIDRCASVARALVAGGARVVVVGGPNEAELLRDVRTVAGVLDLVGRTPLAVLAAVIARADLVVANDSGPMHLADAFARPQVVLYSGTELESQWQPRRSPARLLRVDTACSPCHLFTCPFAMECLDIEPATVVAAVHELLASRASTPVSTVPCAS